MPSFRLICQDDDGHWYVMEHRAASSAVAFEEVARDGRNPRVIYLADLPRSQEDRIIKSWRKGSAVLVECTSCGYSLKGLQPDAQTGLLVCPECGVGAASLEGYLRDKRGRVVRSFNPGRPCEIISVICAVAGTFMGPVYVAAALLLGVASMEVSRGARGAIALVVSLLALVFRAVIEVGNMR